MVQWTGWFGLTMDWVVVAWLVLGSNGLGGLGCFNGLGDSLKQQYTTSRYGLLWRFTHSVCLCLFV